MTLNKNDKLIKLDIIAQEVKTDELVMIVFPNFEENYNDHIWLFERKILSLNSMMLQLLIMNCYVVRLELSTFINQLIQLVSRMKK